ncbi:MAG: CDGSH iron-sulfur domain-containing protein [Dehalococcoidia bacterium]|nr:CDGSH iron-sulfur domain-containing protein [Dehalococcoidia bacterium]MCA9825018.1 CDGSH iron-sulfur domain-containing protein [Dehalococcoidia bacterium]MCA9843574.1 CDGSH iron-sulfur domain-containing protein [Dehalococcoidia bacterium]MCA9854565.1 CDGSH iron-sulfur domain-containing protein [Dehalococcoidia bacterium]
MTDATISIRDNGPYLLKGAYTLVDADGKTFEVEGTTALCRCGLSARKPFCDATHRSEGFESSPRATQA